MPVIEPFEVVFVEDGAFSVSFSTAETIAVDMGEIQKTGFEPIVYDGEYEVNPIDEAQRLATKNRFLLDDVRVNPIPYLETPMPQGGIAITIGG